MSLLATLEQKFGRFAIPNLIRVLAIFQLLNWVLIAIRPEFTNQLVFDSEAIKQGEIWRLVSYVLLPGGQSIIWVLFIGFQFMLNDGLEEAWGSFRLNLYMFAGIFFVAVGGMIFGMATGGGFLWVSVLLAFAVYFPNQEILLYFIIPLKIKWLAWIAAAGALLSMSAAERRVEVICSLLNFVVTFGPGLIKGVKHQATVTSRRQRYEAEQRSEDEPLHRCSVCGRSGDEHRQLEFRVNANGDDVCNECRAAAKA